MIPFSHFFRETGPLEMAVGSSFTRGGFGGNGDNSCCGGCGSNSIVGGWGFEVNNSGVDAFGSGRGRYGFCHCTHRVGENHIV